MARKLDDEKRMRILNAARDAFGAEGFQKTTIKGIARSTGLAPGTIYTYFKNKENLFDEVVVEIWDTFDRGIKRISLESNSIIEKVTGFLDFSFDLLVEIHPLLRGMYNDAVRRELDGSKIEVICSYIEELFVTPEGMAMVYHDRSPETRHFNLNIMVSGILFRISLTKPEDLPREIVKLKGALFKAIAENLSPEMTQ